MARAPRHAEGVARALALAWAGPGPELEGVRAALSEFVVGSFESIEDQRPGLADRALQNAYEAFRAPTAGRPDPEIDPEIHRAIAEFLLGQLAPEQRSLWRLFGIDDEPEVAATPPEPADPAEYGPDDDADLEREEAEEAAAQDELRQALQDLGDGFQEWFDEIERWPRFLPALGKFPKLPAKLGRAADLLARSTKKLGAAPSVLAFMTGVAVQYGMAEGVCRVLRATLGRVFVSSPRLGNAIEQRIRDVAIQTLGATAPDTYLVYQSDVYDQFNAYYVPGTPSSVRFEARRRERQFGDVSLQALRRARRGGRRGGFIRRRGAASSREDLIVFTGRAPGWVAQGVLAADPLPSTIPFPEFYEIKPIASVTDAPRQVAAYVVNYALAWVAMWVRGNRARSPTPVMADPSGNTIQLPALTLVSAGRLVRPVPPGGSLGNLGRYADIRLPSVIIPFMVMGAAGVVPYVVVDVKAAAAAAALAAALKKLLDEIDKAIKRIRETAEEFGRQLGEALEALGDVLLLFLVGTLAIAALVVALLSPAGPPILAGATILLIVLVTREMLDQGPARSPDEFILTMRIGGFTVTATGAQFRERFALFQRLLGGLSGPGSGAPVPVAPDR